MQRLERFNFEKGETRRRRHSAARPKVSGKTALFPRNDRPYGLKCKAFQTENALFVGGKGPPSSLLSMPVASFVATGTACGRLRSLPARELPSSQRARPAAAFGRCRRERGVSLPPKPPILSPARFCKGETGHVASAFQRLFVVSILYLFEIRFFRSFRRRYRAASRRTFFKGEAFYSKKPCLFTMT